MTGVATLTVVTVAPSYCILTKTRPAYSQAQVSSTCFPDGGSESGMEQEIICFQSTLINEDYMLVSYSLWESLLAV